MKRRPADNHLSRDEWDEITLRLLVRSGGLCEARTPSCLAAPTGMVTGRPDGRVIQVSRHHRVPQGSGGTSDPDAHDLDRVLLLCGDGVAGCHGWVESHRDVALARGLLIARRKDMQATARAAAQTPLELASGRLVLLDPVGVFYRDAGWRLTAS